MLGYLQIIFFPEVRYLQIIFFPGGTVPPNSHFLEVIVYKSSFIKTFKISCFIVYTNFGCLNQKQKKSVRFMSIQNMKYKKNVFNSFSLHFFAFQLCVFSFEHLSFYSVTYIFIQLFVPSSFSFDAVFVPIVIK